MGSKGAVPAVVNLGSRQRRDQLHVPAALLPGKGPLKRKAGHFGGEKKKKKLFSYYRSNPIFQLVRWSVIQQAEDNTKRDLTQSLSM
jgi:hypothetical protein